MATYTNQAAVKDCMISSFATDKNYGNGNTLEINGHDKAFNRFLLQFDLSDLPAGTSVTAATLSLYCHTITDGAAVGKSVSLRRLVNLTNWDEGVGGDYPGTTDDACWLRYKAGSNWPSGSGGKNDTSGTNAVESVIPSASNWMAFSGANMLALVQDAITNRSNVLDLMVLYTSEGGTGDYRASFWTRHYATPSLRPKLVLTIESSPTVDTNAASGIKATEATLSGDVTDDIGESIDDYGFIWGTDQGDLGAIEDGDDGPDDVEGGTITGWEAGTGTSEGEEFTHLATGLAAGTQYYARAAAHNSYGWGYGDVVTFNTVFSHTISNENTPGIKLGGQLVTGARIYFIDVLNDALEGAAELSSAGFYEHNIYTAESVHPAHVAVIVHDIKASLTTDQGSNKDLKFTAKMTDADHCYPGEAGNSLTVTYVHDSEASSVSVSASGADITITLKAGTHTAAQIKAAVEAETTHANKMVSVAYAAGQNGSGTPAAMSKTSLAGGAYYTAIAHAFVTPEEI
jgi:hypothetical protein